MIYAGERNFQSEENLTLSLHDMVSMCKGRRESLVDNHIMGNVLKMGNSRVITNRDSRLTKRVWPTPRERKEFGPKRSVTGHSSDDSLSVRSMVRVS